MTGGGSKGESPVLIGGGKDLVTLLGSFHRLHEPDASLEVFDDHIVLDDTSFPFDDVDSMHVRTPRAGRSDSQAELIVEPKGSPEIVLLLPDDEATRAGVVISELVERGLMRPPDAPDPAGSPNGARSELRPIVEPLEYRPLSYGPAGLDDVVLKVVTGVLVLVSLVMFVVIRHSHGATPVATYAPLPSPHAAEPSAHVPTPHATPGKPVVLQTHRTRPSPKPTHRARPRPTHHVATGRPSPVVRTTTSGATVAPPPPALSPRATQQPTPPARSSPAPGPKPRVTTPPARPSPSIKISPPPPPKPTVTASAPAPSPSISIGALADFGPVPLAIPRRVA